MSKYILAIDQGTTSSRALVFDNNGNTKSIAQKEFTQYFPKPGWVEHDANEIWSSQMAVTIEAVSKAKLHADHIAAIGITNQRETTIVWNRKTGEPVYNAIVWQDRRTADYCDQLIKEGWEEKIRGKTGLVIDAYFVATKVKWILDNVDNARGKAEAGELVFGTVDSWLLWNLTNGHKHITDITNASRTLLFNIHTLNWDQELLDLFKIPRSMLPEVCDSSGDIAHTSGMLFARKIPITGVAGDQHAALFGQMCTKEGMVKNTYGTGCFMLMNIGNKPLVSKNKLLTTIAWKIGNEIHYALEGSIFISGAVVQWLRDGLGLIKTAKDSEKMARSVKDTDGVYFVPAFTGLGAPYWNQHAKGTMVGISRGTTAAHIVRASLESIAFQTHDVLKAMEADSNISIKELRVDGGATENDFLMQFQSTILDTQIIKSKTTEVTALGAAYLAGLGVGFWKDQNDIIQKWKVDKTYSPEQDSNVEKQLESWKKAVQTTNYWTNPN
ncbi:glycerol kinase [Galbibacter marinus]|uniref:Glycerol kinase n=1 Tax=Galbibacter marinus TaxID=555500 RepID=K2NZH4_9FLAO|nr:glycerol kinase GlpK [Galbibacter marinus]EKF54198.1 glycerol kinase [Galbibacter marinus]